MVGKKRLRKGWEELRETKGSMEENEEEMIL